MQRNNQDIGCINCMDKFNMLGKARKNGKRDVVFGKKRICKAIVHKFWFFQL